MGDGCRTPATDAFTPFADNMKCESILLSTMVGLVGAASCFIGVEAGAHMPEEVRNSPRHDVNLD